MLKKLKILWKLRKLYKNWITYILDTSSEGDGIIRLKFRNGLVMRIREKSFDRSTVTGMWLDKPYFEPKDVKNKIVIDIGSHIGSFSLWAAYHGAKEVYAYEVHPENFQLMVSNININKFENIRAYNKAVGGKKEIKMEFEEFSGTRKSNISSIISNKGIDVDHVTLDEILKPIKSNSVVIKMDCEGSEFPILFDTKSFRKIKKISLEYHDNYYEGMLGKDLIKILSKHFGSVRSENKIIKAVK